MADGRYLRMFLADCKISVKFSTGKQNSTVTEQGHVTKTYISRIQDRSRPPYCKSLNRYNSTKKHLITTKFSTQQQT